MPDSTRCAKDIFLAALAAEPPRRGAVLDQLCGDDTTIRSHVEALLAAHEGPDTLLDSSRIELGLQEDAADSGRDAPWSVTEASGAIIGPYKLLQRIGDGGMGVVYMAEQEEPVSRRVALKIIKPGMDSRQVVARFDAERHALSMMDHPNIAKVLDAGATRTGRPYFVMELVKGMPITQYCDEHQLSPRHRLELFVPVCHAVQHAHQKGIIHRDIKPTNILVAEYDDRPVPKIIDFGVAKAIDQRLTQQTMFTELGQVVGTVEYMSPEQAKLNQLDIDTRSDVYSLGVLLYELLAGETPFDRQRLRSAAFDELLRIIREEEPPKPSTRLSTSKSLPFIAAKRRIEPAKLSALVHGELDWIVMKALEKERSRRYETANALAADIEHYLSDEPVLACPPSAGYRLRKFARRHRPLLATAGVVAAILLLASVVSTWQAVRARRAERTAVAERRIAESERSRAVNATTQAVAAQALAQYRAEELRRNLYFAQMRLAGQAADSLGGLQRVTELLDHWRSSEHADLRGWEWYYLEGLCHRDLMTLRGHDGTVWAVAWSPDGTRLASAGQDKTARIWDAVNWKPIVTLTGHRHTIHSLAWSPDSRQLATASYDGTVKIWSPADGRSVLDFQGHTDFVQAVAWSPDGRHVASAGSDNTIRVWDAKTGQETVALRGHPNRIEIVAWNPDSRRLASGGFDNSCRIWDTVSGAELFALRGHGTAVRALAWSPDGSQLLTTGIFESDYRIWDATTGRQIRAFDGGNGTHWAAWSPDGKTIATAHYRERVMRTWDVATGAQKSLLRGHLNQVFCLAWKPDGHQLATSSVDGTVKIWDSSSPGEAIMLRGVANPSGAGPTWSPDGTRVAARAPDGTLKVWDAANGQETLAVRASSGNLTYHCWSPDGSRLAAASADASVRIFDARSGEEMRSLPTPARSLRSLAWSPDGAKLAAGSNGSSSDAPPEDPVIFIWDLGSAESPLQLRGHWREARGLAWDPQSKRLAAGDLSRLARIWDAERGTEIARLSGHETYVDWSCWSPDGSRLATSSHDGTVRIWDAGTGTELHVLRGHSDFVWTVMWSPDGTRLISSEDGATKIWDAATGKECLTLPGDGLAAWSPDGMRLAAQRAYPMAVIRDASIGYAHHRSKK